MSEQNESNAGGELSDLDGLKAVGDRIAALSRPLAPENLAAKTVAYVSAHCPPKKRVFWMLQPITHPAARVAAAAVIVMLLSPLTDLETGANLGTRIEQKIIGPQMTDRLEAFVDQMIPAGNGHAEAYFDSFLGVNRPAAPKKAPAKASQRRV